MKVFKYLKKYQYSIICFLLSVFFIILGFLRFPNFLGRFFEAHRDIFNSFRYAFNFIFNGFLSDDIVTVNSMPNSEFLNLKTWAYKILGVKNSSSNSTLISFNWEIFLDKWKLYWATFWNPLTFYLYLYHFFNFLYWILSFLMWFLPISILSIKLFKRFYFKEKIDCYSDSKSLKAWHKVSFVFKSLFNWFLNLIIHIKERFALCLFWIILFLLYFNVFTIILEFFAYYIYLSVSFDFKTFVIQIYKLFLDLKPFITFVPWYLTIILFLFIFSKIARKKAYNRLRHNERRNRGFINELGVVSYIYSEMGAGKTTMLTDMALSMEIQLRNDAFEIMLECDACFPTFPWLSFENELKSCYENHIIYDKWSCLRWIVQKEKEFCDNPCSDTLFGYDVEKEPLTYNNNLYEETIFETLRDYALAYTIYITQSSLIVSNYSIRVDSLINDLGNLPLWDTDFFNRDSRLIDSFSRHSHILDFDMIRLGNQIVKNNPNRYAFGWGVWVITEADKEFKNTLELQEIKGLSEECNQKNDLTHVLFKMSRHACYIRHRNMVRIIADMQRIENITANLRGIGNVLLIESSSDEKTTLPFFSPFRIFSPFLMTFKNKLDDFYSENRFYRSDKRLISNFVEFLRSSIHKWYDRATNLFGYKCLEIVMQSGRLEGKVKNSKYFISFKKAYSKRNGSDCMAGTFESRGAQNLVGLNDMQEYADYIATQDELLEQHSYIQAELEKYRGDTKMDIKTDIKAIEKLLSANLEAVSMARSNKITLSDDAFNGAKALVKELSINISEWVDNSDGD